MAAFHTRDGATMGTCECREIDHPRREMFRICGMPGTFKTDRWLDNRGWVELA